MRRQNVPEGSPADLVCSAVFALAAVAVSVWSMPTAVTVAVGLPFLLFVPGYAVTVALFPRRRADATDSDPEDDHGGLSPFERVVLAVVTSVALAVVVGVNLDHTTWSIRLPTVVGVLAAVTVGATGIGFARRYWFGRGVGLGIGFRSSRGPRPASEGTRDEPRSLPDGGPSVATVVVAVAVVTALVSVSMVAGTNQRGERYTEFGLLTENEAGELVATGHPTELSVGEPTTFHFAITNEERRTVDYTVVVQLSVVEPGGDVASRTPLERFDERLAAGETVRHEHTVTPTVAGDDLRLTYLLYRGEPPERPTDSNAYRDLHLWVDVAHAEPVGPTVG